MTNTLCCLETHSTDAFFLFPDTYSKLHTKGIFIFCFWCSYFFSQTCSSRCWEVPRWASWRFSEKEKKINLKKMLKPIRKQLDELKFKICERKKFSTKARTKKMIRDWPGEIWCYMNVFILHQTPDCCILERNHHAIWHIVIFKKLDIQYGRQRATIWFPDSGTAERQLLVTKSNWLPNPSKNSFTKVQPPELLLIGNEVATTWTQWKADEGIF